MYNKILITCLILFFNIVNAADFKDEKDKVQSSETDVGTQAIIDAQNSVIEPPTREEYISPSDLLNEYLGKKYGREGWHKDKNLIIAIGDVSWNTEDPAFDPTFAKKRSLFATRALMTARVQMIEFMRTQMSAADILKAPYNSAQEQLAQKYRAAERQFIARKSSIAKILKRYDEQEAEVINGASWGSRGKALLDGAIKKLDENYSANTIEEKDRVAFEKTKQQYKEAVEELNKLETEAEGLKGAEGDTMCSNVNVAASGALLGSTQLATAEGWNEKEKRYEVASLAIWSPKLRKSAEAILAGNAEKLKGKKGKTLESWLSKQDFSSLLGPRQLIDENGNRWFIGVYASDYEGSAGSRSKSRRNTQAFALKEAVMSAFSNVSTNKTAEACIKNTEESLTYTKTEFAESSAEETSQFIDNLQISGGSPILKKEVTHPLTNTKMYVVVYAISAEAAAAGMAAEKDTIAGVINIENYQNQRRGTKAGYDQALSEAKNDKTSYNSGKSAGYTSAKQEAAKNSAVTKNAKSSKSCIPAKDKNQSTSENCKTKSGSIINVEDTDDDDF